MSSNRPSLMSRRRWISRCTGTGHLAIQADDHATMARLASEVGLLWKTRRAVDVGTDVRGVKAAGSPKGPPNKVQGVLREV